MVFNSVVFWIFLAGVYFVYRALPHRGQNAWLLGASFLFYGLLDLRFLALIAFTTTFDYAISRWISASTDPRTRRRLLALGVGSNLAVLCFFKYAGFFVESMRALAARFGATDPGWHFEVFLPVGISFYTFHCISYTVDVYRRILPPARSWSELALYTLFFPQLVAGPIARAGHLLPQVQQPRVLDTARLSGAWWLILWGLYKKVVVADNLALNVDAVFSGETPRTFLYVLIALYGFAFQIYCDFSGYSDIACGLARLFGFNLAINFRNPYFSRNPAEFWQRWHISLSTWLRDYLYIPLGGNRLGSRRTYVNLMVTMLLGGLWHGAAWTFVVWGAYQGLLLVLHRLMGARGEDPAPRPATSGWSLLHIVGTFHLVCLGWLFFRARTLGEVSSMLAGLFTWESPQVEDFSHWLGFVVLTTPLLLVEMLQRRTGSETAPMQLSLLPRTALFFLMLLSIWALGNTSSATFIYFQF